MKSNLKKITHEMAVFYILFTEHLKNREQYHPPNIVDVGDVLVKELNKWVFTTWKTPARFSEIFQENPDLLERVLVKSKSGSKYYKYRLNINFVPRLIKDGRLQEFFEAITDDYKPQVAVKAAECEHGLPTFVECPYCSGAKQ
ncbi:hypothetical protein A2Z56_02510 [Candidatus Kaiserbacteria bacterium RIFCSPHIGHO2_12_45_16]|nr:MAG: hypothetical protein A2Z56_02510 [Candidatus Kaiserbacteria bacterium RIFCSPHIGHO2_12_45_16]